MIIKKNMGNIESNMKKTYNIGVKISPVAIYYVEGRDHGKKILAIRKFPQTRVEYFCQALR